MARLQDPPARFQVRVGQDSQCPPLVDGNQSRDCGDSTFEAVVDVASPSLPLWVIWMYRVFDRTDGHGGPR